MTATPLLKLEARPLERRRHQRVKVAILGRYMLPTRQEYPCQTVDMSPGGVALFVPVQGEVGDRVVCYLDQIGRIEGVIARLFTHGFAMQINVPLIKREKLAEQLTWLANRQTLGMPEDRRHERILPRNTRSTLVLPDKREVAVKLIDVSLSGVAMTSDIKPQVGTPVTVGQTAGHVVRSFGTGIAVEFSRSFTAEEFSPDIVL